MRKILLLLATLLCCAHAFAAVTAVSPARGATFTATTVQIHGFDLQPTPVRVFFGELEATVVRVTATGITVLAPPQRAGTTVDVHVQFANGTRLTLPQAFTYVETEIPQRRNQRTFLVPLRTGDVHGANGSLWRTELVVHNADNEDVLLLANNCDYPLRTPPCSRDFIPVRSYETRNVTVDPGLSHLEGTYLYVPETQAENFDATVRVRDVSRENEGFGTEVPVVPLESFKRSIRLLDVPVDGRYRVMLRIYGQSQQSQEVVVSVFPASGAGPIEQVYVRLERGDALNHDPSFPFVSAYARFDPISPAVRASGQTRVRLQIDALELPRVDPPLMPPVWAFVSLTNNTTHQVTTIVPQR